MIEENSFRTSKDVLNDEIEIVDKSNKLQKFVISVAIFLFLYVGGAFLLRFMVNTNILKNNFNKNIQNILKISDKNNKSFEIYGNITFHSFFTPYLVIKDIKAINLTQNNHVLDFNIKEIKLYLSTSGLLTKKVVAKKIEIIDGYFDIKTSKNNQEINIEDIKQILNAYSKNILTNNDIPIYLINNEIKFSNELYTRNFTNINLESVLSNNKLNISGNLFSNRQPLKIDFNIRKNKKEYLDLKLNLSSQAFNTHTNAKITYNNNSFEGNTTFNIFNLQLFSKTIFDSENFFYKRIIGDTDLKGKFSFKYDNKVFFVNNFGFAGKDLNGSGEVEINLTKYKDNKINLYFNYVNFDNLLIKNFINKTANNISEDEIFIFSGKMSQKAQKKNYKSYIEKIFSINQTNFDIAIKNAMLNQSNISNAILSFSYFNNHNFLIKNFSSILPGETKVLVKITPENKNSIIMSSNNLEEFWSFVKNTKYVKKDKQEKFTFTGFFDIINDTIFFNNVNFNTQNLKTNNAIEIGLDNGISYVAINSNIENVDVDKIIDNIFKEEKNTGNLLKNRLLFLNDFSLHSFLKFNIRNIKYNNIMDHNYSFIITTSQGVFNIRDINLNNEISGNIDVNIKQFNPTINISLNINNHNFQNGILFNKLLFAIPTFEDINGSVLINGKNSTFKNSKLNNFTISSTLKNGIFNFDDFNIDGFGGKCKITGFLDLNFNRKLNVVFNACTSSLEETLYLFTKSNNIGGLIGFSSVLYSQGNTLNSFMQNYIFKMQLIGNGIIANGFGLYNLNSDLLKLNVNPKFVNTINPNSILFDKDKKTVFDSLSGNIQYYNEKGQIDIDLSRPLINGKMSGTFEFNETNFKLDALLNFIMLVGNLNTRPISLTVPTSINGDSVSGFKNATNYKQINEYLNTIRAIR